MKAWEITKKDLMLLVRDRRTLATLVILPLIFITLIGLTIGKLFGWKSAAQNLKIAYVVEAEYQDFDDLPPARMLRHPKRQENLVTKIVNGMQGMSGVEVFSVANRDKLQKMLKADKADGGLIIGPEFVQRVSALEIRDLSPTSGKLDDGLASFGMEFTSSEPDSSKHSVLEGLLTAKSTAAVSGYLFCSYQGGGIAERAEIVRQCRSCIAEANEPLIEYDDPQPDDDKGDSTVYNNLIPQYTVMFVFFLINIMARSFIHERSLGTLRRLRMAPIRPVSLMAGKTIPFLIISLIQSVLLFLCGKLMFDMSWGVKPLLLLPVIICTSLSATSLGLLVATLVRTDAQVSAYGNAVVIVMAGISGCFMPREWLPPLMQQISLFTPHAWALIAYKELLSVTDAAALDKAIVFESCGMLLVFTALFFVGGWKLFGKVD